MQVEGARAPDAHFTDGGAARSARLCIRLFRVARPSVLEALRVALSSAAPRIRAAQFSGSRQNLLECFPPFRAN
jgi:hypothetical protein